MIRVVMALCSCDDPVSMTKGFIKFIKKLHPDLVEVISFGVIEVVVD
ncbi:hypothetical protein [Splendidivirga corallicola]